MHRRSIVAVAMLLATSLGSAATGWAAPGEPNDPERFMLSCTGAMATDGSLRPDKNDPAHRIVATAVVDLAERSLKGFGIGAVPVVNVTPGMIGFGNAGVDTFTLAAEPAVKPKPGSGTLIEGSFDRDSGDTLVIVRPGSDPARALIAMNLDCRIEQAPQ